jgi:hypothetical protein
MSQDNIYTALFRFHTIVGSIPMNSRNPYFSSRYASLSDVLKSIQHPLQQCNLLIVHQLLENDSMTTSVVHAPTGGSISSTFKLHIKGSDSQAWGSAITYAKRYAIGAMLNLCIDPDDDGNASSGKTKQVQSSSTAVLEVGDDNWAKAVHFIRNGGTVSAIEKKYNLTAAAKAKLENIK